MKTISIQFTDGSLKDVILEEIPDTYSVCNTSIDPVICFGHGNKRMWNDFKSTQVVFKCTKNNCQKLFIANYELNGPSAKNFYYKFSEPKSKTIQKFPDTVKEISQSFCDIYNEAHSAEEDNLLEICGGGYRKALEFLIKDYIKLKNPEKSEEIESKSLGNCIKEDVEDVNIKFMAEKAAWLSNDELHYVRKWEDKDLQDLKNLIKATIHYIEMEKLKKSFE